MSRGLLHSLLCLSPVLALACSSGNQLGGIAAPVPEAGTDSVFTSLELSLIRSEFARLPSAAPADATNQFADNPLAAKFGQELFFDTRFSQNGQVSCATCHDPAHGFSDNRSNTSLGLAFTGRHAPSVINAAFGSGEDNVTVWQFWDGRKDSLWSQALGPAENPPEMGGTRTKIALLVFDKYQSDYNAVFPTIPALRDAAGNAVAPDTALPSATDTAADMAWSKLSPAVQNDINTVFVNFAKALEAYERLLVSRDSRFDQFHDDLAAGADDSDELSAGEKTGLKLFVGSAGCISCHRGPNLTDGKFHDIGVPQTGDHVPAEDDGRQAGVAKLQADPFNCAGAWSDRPDKTGCEVTTLQAKPADLGAFKTPSLRGVTALAPYFHTGAAQTLADVVELYDSGGADSGYVGERDKNINALGLTADEKARIVDLLSAFDGKPIDTALTTPPPLPQ
jgi:cytochrome c peroxidase